MHAQTIIGLDVGRSAAKARAFANGQEFELTFPSLVCHAIALSDENSIRTAEPETIVVEGRRYFTGDTARLQGGVTSSAGLSHDWTETQAYQALVLSTLKRLARMGVSGLESPCILVGTPAALYGKQRERLEELTRKAAPTCRCKSAVATNGRIYFVLFEQKGISDFRKYD